MLRHIHIRNFAIIDHIAIDFADRLSVMTGETGAGKSILIDALGLLLGERAGSEVIRNDAERAELEALFSATPSVQAKLHELGLEDESGECLLRRVIAREGASRAWVNGRSVNLSTLRELGSLLVDIHGQHEHQQLLRPAAQRELLDAYANHPALLAQVKNAYDAWRSTQQRLSELHDHQAQRSQRLELLEHQLHELHALKLAADEWPKLEAEHRRLAQAGKLLQLTHGALALLDEGSDSQKSLHRQVAQLAHQFEAAQADDAALSNISELLQQAEINLAEAIASLQGYVSDLELDPARLQSLEARLSSLHDLARKHRIRPEQLYAHQQALAEEYATLAQGAASLDELTAQLAKHEHAYRQAADALHASRQRAAQTLSDAVTTAIRGLGMPHAHFAIQLASEETFSPHGLDRIDMLVTTNPGQPLQPLGKVASGGELSRISLALRVQTAAQGDIETLIFDEVDTGIGGSVAEIVGRLLAQLGQSRQVLCVTHLPQVAAQGQHHFNVQKQQDAHSTRTLIRPLNAAERIDELARMIGGVNISAQTRTLAEEMLQQAAH